jgi:LacI family transcriptional regulator
MGHRRIGFITNAPLTYVAGRERYRGYQDSLLAADLIYDPAIVRTGHFTSDSGFEAMNQLLELPDPPTAVFVASDVVAIGAMGAARVRGLRIPDDVAVIGFDDVSIARYVEPALSTVRLPAYDLGWHVGQLALRLVNQERPENDRTLLAPELVIRDSSGVQIPRHEPVANPSS